MRRADQIGGLLLLVFGVWYGGLAWLRYPYWSDTGPGTGFFPLWLGGTMTALALLLLARATRQREPGPAWLPPPDGRRRLVAILVVTVLFVAGLKLVGMILGTVLFLVVVLRLIEGYRWRTALAIAVGTAAANYLVFTYWLAVPFPVSPLGF